ncbi:carbohydrate porin [Vibrio sp. WXL103]|uniref:carbohydrate porin n=1 Tax=Vibrio sp. WXL103 TaxID=3450710 RepID=UPI003EC59A0A
MDFKQHMPQTLAIGCALTSLIATADEANISELTQRIQKLETEVAASRQPLEAPLGVIFSGYARYGAHIATGDNRYVQVGTSGAAVGRLGNEANGGEFQLGKVFVQDNGAQWDLAIMVDHWANDTWSSPGGIDLKKAYAGVSNVFASQPDLYLWGGRNFHQRPQQGINDYFWMMHDGQGGGFQNLNLGFAKFDLGVVGQIDFGEGGSLGNDSGRYAVTNKLHGIDVGIGTLDLYYNYGFATEEAEAAVQDETARQVGASLALGQSNKLILRYSDGADDSVFDLAGDVKALYASFEGGYNTGRLFAIDYLVSYKEVKGKDAAALAKDERSEYAGIVRPMLNWNQNHSTWFEAGVAVEDYVNDDQVSGWKFTVSQNISIGGMPWSRPMLRLYATIGEVEDQQDNIADTTSLGVMFESWW